MPAGSRASHRLLLGGWDDFVDADAEIVVQNQHFAAGDEAIVDENIHRITGQFVQFDDAAFVELQDFFDQHPAAAQLDLDVQLDIAKKIDAGDLGIGHHLLKAGQLEASASLPGKSPAPAVSSKFACWRSSSIDGPPADSAALASGLSKFACFKSASMESLSSRSRRRLSAAGWRGGGDGFGGGRRRSGRLGRRRLLRQTARPRLARVQQAQRLCRRLRAAAGAGFGWGVCCGGVPSGAGCSAMSHHPWRSGAAGECGTHTLLIRRERDALRNQDIVDQSIADDFIQLILDLPAERFQPRLGATPELFRIGLGDYGPNSVLDQGIVLGNYRFYFVGGLFFHRKDDFDIVKKCPSAALVGEAGFQQRDFGGRAVVGRAADLSPSAPSTSLTGVVRSAALAFLAPPEINLNPAKRTTASMIIAPPSRTGVLVRNPPPGLGSRGGRGGRGGFGFCRRVFCRQGRRRPASFLSRP